jgi:hypothetical protein
VLVAPPVLAPPALAPPLPTGFVLLDVQAVETSSDPVMSAAHSSQSWTPMLPEY